MKAMILAAGRGERLRPLTDTIPKPLVIVRGKPLIVHHIENLAKAGIDDIVINCSYLGEKIKETLGNGQQFGVKIHYSQEPNDMLETGGGIFNALPLLGNAPFLTVNADIFTDFDFSVINASWVSTEILAHLILVPKYPEQEEGNFSLKENTLISNDYPRPYLASGITVYHPDFFKNCEAGHYSIAPLWRNFADKKHVNGTVFDGVWHDVGTLKRLEQLNAILHPRGQY